MTTSQDTLKIMQAIQVYNGKQNALNYFNSVIARRESEGKSSERFMVFAWRLGCEQFPDSISIHTPDFELSKMAIAHDSNCERIFQP